MNPTQVPNTEPITLEHIIQQKTNLKKQIQQQKEIMNHLAKGLVAPVEPATSKGNAMIKAFHTGMAAFDGIMMGVKIMRKIRKLFK